MRTNDIDSVLQTFRRDLPNNSKTAQAIDRGAPIEEISGCAEKEGVHQLAAILFEAQQEEGQSREEGAASLEAVVRERLAVFREDLPDESETAQAIDRKAPLGDISEHAQAEGLNEIAAVLFEAQQERARA